MHKVIGLHDSCLHFDANSASANFAPVCNRHLHGNAQNADMTAEQEERDRLRLALVAFYDAAKKSGSIKSVNQWATASGLAPNTINPVLNGSSNKRIEDESYFKLSVGASKLLRRTVTVAELQGSKPEEEIKLTEREIRLIKKYRDGGKKKQDIIDSIADAVIPDNHDSQE